MPPGLFFFSFILAHYLFCKTGETIWFILVLIEIYLLSIQLIADALIKPLENYYKQVPASTLNDVDAIVVLTGGYNKKVPDFNGKGQIAHKAANRFIMSLRLYNALHIPIVISGTKEEAEIATRTLKACGVKDKYIIIENQSRNTAENAFFTGKLCRQLKIEKILLITSASHLPRSTILFRREKLNVIPYPTDYKSNQFPKLSLLAFAPSSYMLCNSATAFKEYLGILALKIGLQ